MAINRTSLSAQSVSEFSEAAIIEMRSDLPRTDIDLNPPEPPGKVIGYYNGSTGFVELYVVGFTGLRLLPI